MKPYTSLYMSSYSYLRKNFAYFYLFVESNIGLVFKNPISESLFRISAASVIAFFQRIYHLYFFIQNEIMHRRIRNNNGHI